MPGYLGALTLVLMAGMVASRVVILRRGGIEAMKFGKLDRKDFILPPFALFYFYLVFAAAFHWPSITAQRFFQSVLVEWIGVLFCLLGLALLLGSLVSFGKSFRVGIDTERPDRLVTDGIFAFSRNPIYLAMWSIFLGQFLIFPNIILLLYLLGALWLVNRQVLREEAYLKVHYGEEYMRYCKQVRRYI
jgi:protein-S-isoprenylcysteine O-methyltransferase Ste14